MARRHGNGELRVVVREGVGKGSGEGCRQLALKRLYEGVPLHPWAWPSALWMWWDAAP